MLEFLNVQCVGQMYKYLKTALLGLWKTILSGIQKGKWIMYEKNVIFATKTIVVPTESVLTVIRLCVFLVLRHTQKR